MKRIFLLILILLFVSSCTTQITNYKFISNKNVDINNKYVLVKENVSEKSKQFFIVYLYYDFDDLSYYSALGKCLEKYDAQVMTDCEVTTTFYFFLIGAYVDYKVEGNVWKCLNEENIGSYDINEIYDLSTEDGQQYLVNSNDKKYKVNYKKENG